MSEITAYKCDSCGKVYDYEIDSIECEYKHSRNRLANAMLERGSTLWSINYKCGFGWLLTKEQKEITKDNCFIISHWQCCEKPAYQIRRITDNGNLYVSGKGSWSGYFGENVKIDDYHMKKPYPKEDLFVDQR